LRRRDNNRQKNSYLQLGKFYPPHWGGIETVTYNLESALSKKGYKNSVLVFDDNSSDIGEVSKSKNIARSKYKLFFGAPLSFEYLRTFRKISKNYTHLICHLPNPWIIICLLFCPYKGKIILYWHSDIVNKGILGLILTPLELWIINRASVVIAPTLAHIKYSKYAFKLSKKYKVIPYPINPNIFNIANNNKNPKQISNGHINLIAIGRLVEYKGFECLIRSLTFLPKTFKYKLDIVGDGPLKNYLNELLSELNLSDFVHIHGSVSGEVLSNLLQDATIFCFPSNTKAEMYGMVQYEAMAYGLPIIGADIPGSGAPFLLRDSGAGLLVAIDSPEEIAMAIIKIFGDPILYSTFSSSGKESIISKFNPDALIDEFCNSVSEIF
jgi:glycosyltransferase involved in cell wall biosynthesis